MLAILLAIVSNRGRRLCRVGGASDGGADEGHFADMLAGGAPGDFPSVNPDRNQAAEDEVNVVVCGALLDYLAVWLGGLDLD